LTKILKKCFYRAKYNHIIIINMPFTEKLQQYFDEFNKVVADNNGDWTVKGFIDVYKNIYTISIDTKVVSKIIELMIFPIILKFANENNYKVILSSHQNHYPDITFVDRETGEKIALDIKSTYRINKDKVNGMTLGAFTGYFRNRHSNKNITFPYQQYSKHYILGVIYSKTDLYRAEAALEKMSISVLEKTRKKLSEYISNQSTETFEELLATIKKDHKDLELDLLRDKLDECVIDEKKVFKLEDLQDIFSVVRDFDFFVQEKWKIAIDRPGSGNTKNIGSTNSIKELKSGTALFTKHPNGEEIFSDFWMFYLTKDMARSVDLEEPPYTNLKTYLKYKGIE